MISSWFWNGSIIHDWVGRWFWLSDRSLYYTWTRLVACGVGQLSTSNVLSLITSFPTQPTPGTMHTVQMSQKYLCFKYISLKEGIQMQNLTITNPADQMRAACTFRNLCFCQLVVPVPLCTSSVRSQQQPIRKRRPQHTSLSIMFGGGGQGWLWVPVFAPL